MWSAYAGNRVKNNMQFIISMYRLKLSGFMNKNLKTALNETEGSIQAMSATHEMLYDQNDLENIDSKKYLENLSERLSRSFDTSNIKIDLNIDTSLDIEKSIFIGIILNELFTNSFKYAFLDNKGKIDISLKKTEGEFELIYKDNGIGFEKENIKDSFGIKLIETLVIDELKGQIKLDSSSGTFYKILWR
ncbi:MAG: sensor histidine kinase [Campylobacterota bacterium]|nr:sensor histidine kinase [Campylobacterota bacterium]